VHHGSPGEWDAAVDEANPPQWLAAIRLWIDSTEFRIKKTKERGKKSNHHSRKLNNPGRKFMFILDGNSQIRFVSTGMYPKTYDSKWAVANKDLLSLLFRGTEIIGDGHFWKAGETIKDPAIIGRPSTQVKVETARRRGFASTSPELKRRRREVSDFRSRVEWPFGNIKEMFAILSCDRRRTWREDLDRTDDTVHWAVGGFNYKLLHNM